MSTLVVNLDEKVQASRRYKAGTVADYFRTNTLSWWEKASSEQCYKEQEESIAIWLNNINPKPKKMLELGAGFGRITKLLNEMRPEKLRLVEINEKAIRRLMELFPESPLLPRPIEGPGWMQDDYYDLIAAIEVLVHVPNIENLMERIHRSLKTGGFTMVSITRKEWYKSNGRRESPVVRGIDEREFEDFILHDFSIWDCRYTKNEQLLTYLLRKR